MDDLNLNEVAIRILQLEAELKEIEDQLVALSIRKTEVKEDGKASFKRLWEIILSNELHGKTIQLGRVLILNTNDFHEMEVIRADIVDPSLC